MAKTDTTGDLVEMAAPRLFAETDTPHVLSLAGRFTIPPFSVFNARGDQWKQRRRLWNNLGLRSEVGRSARAFASHTSVGKGGRTDPFAKAVAKKEGKQNYDPVTEKILALTNGQSIFDPVLCEMAYRWFSPRGGWVLDPFAGGSVRGIVAGVLGRHYIGVDLSAEQIEANVAQSDMFIEKGLISEEFAPVWIVGDSLDVIPNLDNGEWIDPTWLPPEGLFDFVMSCPPYFDLEKYSDDPKDLSNMGWPGFLAAYEAIIAACVERLHPDRFACFVVGEIRAKDGTFRNFVGETVRSFQDAGAEYYGEGIIVNPAGTLPLRTAKAFETSRKIGKTHQNVQVYLLGDGKRAAAACDPDEIIAEYSDTPDLDGDEESE